MFTKTTIISLLAISLLAIGGIGYSAFTASVTVSANASAGTFGFSVGGAPSVSFSGTDGTCVFTGSGTTISAAATNWNDGTTCTISGNIYNTGSLPGTITEPALTLGDTGGSLVNNACVGSPDWTATLVLSPSSPAAIGPSPSGVVGYTLTISLGPSSNNGCQGTTFSITDTLSGAST